MEIVSEEVRCGIVNCWRGGGGWRAGVVECGRSAHTTCEPITVLSRWLHQHHHQRQQQQRHCDVYCDAPAAGRSDVITTTCRRRAKCQNYRIILWLAPADFRSSQISIRRFPTPAWTHNFSLSPTGSRLSVYAEVAPTIRLRFDARSTAYQRSLTVT